MLQEFFTASNIGLILNAIGSVLVALSIGKQKKGGGRYTQTNGRTYHTAVVNHPIAFKIGLGIIVIGSLLQIHIG